MNKTIFITLLVVVIVALAIYGYMVYRPSTTNTQALNASSTDQQQTVTSSSNQSTDTTQTAASNPITNSVILANLSTGNMVTVNEVSLTKPGYVVLYVIDSNGVTKPIGHSELLSVGMHTGVVIQTDTVVAYSQAVVAVVHQDNGNGVFDDQGTDSYLVNTNGSVVSDIDVVGVEGVSKEAQALQLKVEAYLKNLKTNASSSTSVQ